MDTIRPRETAQIDGRHWFLPRLKNASRVFQQTTQVMEEAAHRSPATL
jgi:hypothetical protein